MKPNKVYSIEVRPPSAVQDDHERNRGNTFFKKPFSESLKKSRASYDGRLTASNIVLDTILLENTCPLGAALFSRIFAINSSDQKKILARLKKMVLEHSQKIGATRQPFLGQLLLFLPTARR